MTTPLPDNFTIRAATMDDLEAVVAVLNACAMEEIGKPGWDADEIRRGWQGPQKNMETDTRVVIASGGALVGIADLGDSRPHVQIWATGCVRPEYRGRGIGSALCQWIDRRARQSMSLAPKGARIVLVQWIPGTATAAQELLRAQGYQLVRHDLRMVIEMDEPPPEPALPEGIAIRTFDRSRDLRALIRADNDGFRDHWGHVERPFEDEYRDWVHWIENDPHHDPTLWFLAVEGEEIVGDCMCEPRTAEDPEMGFVDSLAVRRPWRRRGIALALLYHSLGEFYRRGTRKVGLEVDAQSLTGATRLYEKAGMRVERQYTIYEKELRPGKDLSTQSLVD